MSFVRSLTTASCTLLVVACAVRAVAAGDLAIVPLFDGERSDVLNLWGGPFSSGSAVSLTKQSSVVRSGIGAYRINLGSLPNNGSRFFQTFSSAVSATQGFRQDRDLTPYQSLEGYVRNDVGVPLTLALELKDYRDSSSHAARRTYALPAGGSWTKIEAPLDLNQGWTVAGSPDLQRTFALSFLVDADFGPAAGSLYMDDFSLVENAPSIDPAVGPIGDVVERLARRQFSALWSARNKASGLIPNTSDDVTLGALNATAGVAWMLPSAVRRGWVEQPEADAFMTQLSESLNANRDHATYVPTRFLNFATAAPVGNRRKLSDARARPLGAEPVHGI